MSVDELDDKAVAAIHLEDGYAMFYREHKDMARAEPFLKLFEHTQIKSYSEAMSETVGSIMKVHEGKGRNLHLVNFSKEIFLKFNLPPLHIMKKKIIPEVAPNLIWNETKARPLKFDELSASNGNFRKSEEDNCHLPISNFQ